jgi:hypothetical protein
LANAENHNSSVTTDAIGVLTEGAETNTVVILFSDNGGLSTYLLPSDYPVSSDIGCCEATIRGTSLNSRTHSTKAE